VLKKLKPYTCTANDTFTEELEAFFERINKGPCPHLTNGFDGLRAVTMARAVHHSWATFEAVILEPAR